MNETSSRPVVQAAIGSVDRGADSSVQCPGCSVRLLVTSDLRERGSAIQCPCCHLTMALPDFGGRTASPPPVHFVASAAHNSNGAPLASHVDPGHSPARGDTFWIPLSAACGVCLAILAAVFIAARTPSATPSANDSVVELLKQENQTLTDQIQSLHADLKRREAAVRQLESDGQRLDEENKQLNEKVVFVNRWRGASFIVMDHNDYATAIDRRPFRNAPPSIRIALADTSGHGTRPCA